MHTFLEFFIKKLLIFWLPLYAIYRVFSDIVEEIEKEKGPKHS